jgi:hypothetical protein
MPGGQPRVHEMDCRQEELNLIYHNECNESSSLLYHNAGLKSARQAGEKRHVYVQHFSWSIVTW